MLARRAAGPRKAGALASPFSEHDSRSKLLALRFADLVRTRLSKHRSVLTSTGRYQPPQPLSDVQNQLNLTYA